MDTKDEHIIYDYVIYNDNHYMRISFHTMGFSCWYKKGSDKLEHSIYDDISSPEMTKILDHKLFQKNKRKEKLERILK